MDTSSIPWDTITRIAYIIVPLLIVYIIGSIAIRLVGRAARKRAKTLEAENRIRMARRIIQYVFFAFLVFVGIFYYVGSWTGLGASLALISAGLGFALQKPASNLAAWFVIVFLRPFAIGDRIEIGDIARGDVKDISITNLLMGEVGRFGAEDKTGRTVLLPNSVIFEQAITRYGDLNDHILNEVETTITYESDLDIAKELMITIAKEIAGEESNPHIRLTQKESGITMQLRFTVEVGPANKIASEISEAIIKATKKEPTVDIAYNRLNVNLIK